MLEIIVTFTVTTFVYCCLLFLPCRRVAKHLAGNREAIKAVTEHVLMPLFWAADRPKADAENPDEDEDEDEED